MKDAPREHAAALLRRHRPGDGVVAGLERLCRALTDELALVGAVVTLMPGVGAHAIAAASSTVARRVEEAQFGMGEGPTGDAFTARRPVLIAELDDLGVRRWPGWGPAALAAGVSAAYAFPLHFGASIFGVLTAYADSDPRLEAGRLDTAVMFSESATALLLGGFENVDGQDLEPVLDATLGTNGSIYQAQGKVMVELGISLPEALARMRAHAWAIEQDLSALARDILEGRTMPTRDQRR